MLAVYNINLFLSCRISIILISRKSVTVKSPQNRKAMGFATILQTLFNGK